MAEYLKTYIGGCLVGIVGSGIVMFGIMSATDLLAYYVPFMKWFSVIVMEAFGVFMLLCYASIHRETIEERGKTARILKTASLIFFCIAFLQMLKSIALCIPMAVLSAVLYMTGRKIGKPKREDMHG